ncbi:MAG: pyridoxal phosphate-dependent aminotransferase [Terriglobales bacterium]
MAAPTPAAPPLALRAQRLTLSATAGVLNQAARLRAQGRDLVDLGAGEPDFATPDFITQTAIGALRAHDTKYTPTAGTAALRRAIAEAHARDFGSHYLPEQVVVTSGGKQGLFDAINLLVDHGDEVLLPSPYWVSFRDQIVYAGGTPVLVPATEENGFALSLAALERALSPRTRLILLNSPHNPTGAVYPPELFRAVLALCRARRLWLISDETYARLVYDTAPYSVGCESGASECVLLAGSLSKTYAMTGWRIGYLLAPRALVDPIISLQSQSTGNPTTFAQAGAVAALTGPQDAVGAMLAAYRRRRDTLIAGLNQLEGVHCHLPQGAFYAFANVHDLLQRVHLEAPAALCQRLLEQAGLVSVPGEAFGSPSHLRFSFAAADAVLAEALRRLKTFLSLLT